MQWERIETITMNKFRAIGYVEFFGNQRSIHSMKNVRSKDAKFSEFVCGLITLQLCVKSNCKLKDALPIAIGINSRISIEQYRLQVQ